MAEGFSLRADVRERTGKGAARALRREGKIPAVIYGNNQPPVAIAVPWKPVSLALYGGGFLTNVWTIDVGGRKMQALARDYQREPVKDRLVHVDFLRVTSKSRVAVDVPVAFTDEDDCPALKQQDGVLTVIEHTISLDCPATDIPDNVTASLTGLEIGATITSADLRLPDGVSLANVQEGDEPKPIASITAPVAEEPAETEAEAAPLEDGEADTGETGEGEGGAGEDTPES